jgi:uncharacterized protein involved in exopolysaccharide biosynthesis
MLSTELFKTIDTALVPELKAKPKRALFAVLGASLGGVFSTLLGFIRHFR